MTVDVTTLGIEFDTAPVRRGVEDLKRAEQQGKRTADALDGGATRARASMEALEKSVRIATGAIAALGGINAVRALAAVNDEYASIAGRLKLVTDSSEQLKQVQEELFGVAQRTGAAYGATAELYTRVAQNAKDLNLTQQELLRFTETTAKAFQVSGASAEEAAGAIRQLTQGLAAGALKGEEFNAVAEGGPRIMQALADSLGVSRGALRDMAKEGELTAAVVIEAMRSQSDAISGEFEQLPVTVGRAMQELENEVKRAIAGADVKPLTDSIRELTKTFSDPAVIEAISTFGGALFTLTRQAALAAAGFAELGKDVGYFLAFITGNLTQADKIEREMERIKTALTLDEGFERQFFAAADFSRKSNAELERELRTREGLLARINRGSSFELSVDFQRGVDAATSSLASINKLLHQTDAGLTSVNVPLREAASSLVPFRSAADAASEAARQVGDASGKAAEEIRKANQAVDDQIALLNMQLKYMAKGYAADQAAKLAKAELAKVEGGRARELLRLEAAIDAGTKATQRNKLAAEEAARAVEEYSQATVDAIEAQTASGAQTKALEDQLYYLEQGLSLEDARTAATLNTLRAHARLLDIMGDTDGAARAQEEIRRIELQRQIDGIQASRSAAEKAAADQVEAHRRAQEDIAKQARRTADSITQSLTDALYRGFEDGKGFIKNFIDTLKNTIGSLVLRPVIEFVVSPIAQGIGAILGSPGGAASLVSGGSSLAGGASALGGLGQIFGAGSFFQGLTMVADKLAGVSPAFTGLANSLSTAGPMFQSAANVLGPAALGFTAGNLAGDFLSSNSSRFSERTGMYTGIGAGVGAVAGSVVPVIGNAVGAIGGALIGGALGAVMGGIEGQWRLRSRKLGITLADDLVDATIIERYKKKNITGSSKTRTVTDEAEALDESLADVFGPTLEAARRATSDLGLEMGKFSVSIAESIKGLKGEELEERIAEIIGKATDEFVRQAVPIGTSLESLRLEGENLAQTLVRVANNTVQVNDVLRAFGTAQLNFEQVNDVLVGSSLQAVNAFFERFATEAEKQVRIQSEAVRVFESLNMAVPDSEAALRDLVQGLDLTSQSGQEAFRAIVNNTEALGRYYDTMEAGTKAVEASARSMRLQAERSQQAARAAQYQEDLDRLAQAGRINAGPGSLRDFLTQTGSAEQQAAVALPEWLRNFDQYRQFLNGSNARDAFDRIGELLQLGSITGQTALEWTEALNTLNAQTIRTSGVLGELARAYAGAPMDELNQQVLRGEALREINALLGSIGDSSASAEEKLSVLTGTLAQFQALGLPETDATIAAVENLNAAIAAMGSGAADAAQDLEAIAREREGLERQLLELQGDTAAIRALERAELFEANRELYDRINALRDEQVAAEAAARASEAIAQERNALEGRLLQLQGNTAEIRVRELASLNESNRAIQEQIYALEDQAAAAQAAAEAGQEAARVAEEAERARVQAIETQQTLLRSMYEYGQRIAVQIDELRQRAAQERDAARDGVVSALESLQSASTEAASRLADAQTAAARELRESMRRASESIGATLRELAGTSAGSASLFEQREFNGARFGDLSSRALSGDVAAASELGEAAKAYIDSLRQTSTSTLEFVREERRIRAQLMQVQALNAVEAEDAAASSVSAAQAEAERASQAYADAVAKAAASGIDFGATVAAQAEPFAAALAAYIEAQRVAQAVQAERATAELSLVQQYASLTAQLSDFDARTAGLLGGFTAEVDELGALLTQYADAVGVISAAAATLATVAQAAATPATQAPRSVSQDLLALINAGIREANAARAERGGYGGFGGAMSDSDLQALLSGAPFAERSLATLQGNAAAIADELERYGLTLTQQSAAAVVEDLLRRRYNVEAFAAGGSYRGGLALVGEGGPELINFSAPGQVYNAAQTRQALGTDTRKLEFLVERMSGEIVALKTELREIKRSSEGTHVILRRVTEDGDAMRIVEAV